MYVCKNKKMTDHWGPFYVSWIETYIFGNNWGLKYKKFFTPLRCFRLIDMWLQKLLLVFSVVSKVCRILYTEVNTSESGRNLFRVKHCHIHKSIMYALYSRVFSFSFFEKRLICIKCEILCKHKVEIYSDTQLIVWLYTWMNSNVANVFNGH